MLLIVARPSVVENSMGLSLARAPPSRGLCFRLRIEPTLALHHLGDAEIGGDKIMGPADAGAMPGEPGGIDAGRRRAFLASNTPFREGSQGNGPRFRPPRCIERR